MSAQPPTDPSESPSLGTMRCPRCSAPVAAEQDWCLECGAPARTRLAPTPNWQVPTLAIGAIVLIAGALLAFAFVKLTGDNGATPSQPAPVVATQPVTPPPVVTPTSSTPTGSTPTIPQATPSQTQATTPPTTVPGQAPPKGATTTRTTSTTPRTRTERQP